MAKVQDQFDEQFLKKLEYLYIMSKKIASGAQRADRRTRLVGSGIEFADHRNYAPGDDIRNLDWRVYGRTEKLFLRMFEEEEDLYFYFLIDGSRSMRLGNPDKWSYAQKVCAALSYIGLSNFDRVSIVPFSSKLDGRMPPSRGKAQIFKVFEFLRSVDAGPHTRLKDAFKTFVSQNKRRGVAVVISDFYDPEGFEEGLNMLRYHRFEPIVTRTTPRPRTPRDARAERCPRHPQATVPKAPRPPRHVPPRAQLARQTTRPTPHHDRP
ncbi:MAG: DUF58 domain-containing protein [Prochlorococcaceae cyanobacterium]